MRGSFPPLRSGCCQQSQQHPAICTPVIYSSITMKHHIFIIGLSVTVFSAFAPLAFAQIVSQNDGFLDQEKPDWIEAPVIPPEIYPTLQETIRAANLIIHEQSRLHITSPTYEQAHRLLRQNLLMMQRQLHFNPEALARFQSTSHMARFTVDPRIYSPNPYGIALPNAIVSTGFTNPYRFHTTYYSYTGEKPSRRSIIYASEMRNILRVALR